MVNLELKIYQQYYTKSTPIVEYMVKLLSLKLDDKILEPCGGDGVFIDAIIDVNPIANIDVCELNTVSVAALMEKYSIYKNIRITYCDTLLDETFLMLSQNGGYYDKIIANPPYGAWQEIEKRGILKKIYSNIYSKETYTLFLYRCIELIKQGGILSFIIPDTYLNLHMHKAVRRKILEETKILELALIPSSFFPGVNFGYANLSILTLQRNNCKEDNLANSFNVYTNFKKVDHLAEIEQTSTIKTINISQQKIYDSLDHAFFISEDQKIIDLVNSDLSRIGDIAACVTGFYSGNDKQHLRVKDWSIKNSKNYTRISDDNIRNSFEAPSLIGIEGVQRFIPIVKGGNTKYFKPDSWYMDWSIEAVKNYKLNSKARFQNPSYYFKNGIGVPMVSSSRISASLIENKLFDQSIVGIFPYDKSLTYYLLGFFNSKTCNRLIRLINPSANNPSNYIKKIPFIKPSEIQKLNVVDIVTTILNEIRLFGKYPLRLDEEINEIFENIYGF